MGIYRITLATFVLAGMLLSDVLAQTSNDESVTVIDGDTIKIGDQRIRIHGIDAPEGRQTCARDGVTWLCGQEAGQQLRELVRGSEVTCKSVDQDRYGRIVAKCFAGGLDVGDGFGGVGTSLPPVFDGLHSSGSRGESGSPKTVVWSVRRTLGLAARQAARCFASERQRSLRYQG